MMNECYNIFVYVEEMGVFPAAEIFSHCELECQGREQPQSAAPCKQITAKLTKLCESEVSYGVQITQMNILQQLLT